MSTATWELVEQVNNTEYMQWEFHSKDTYNIKYKPEVYNYNKSESKGLKKESS